MNPAKQARYWLIGFAVFILLVYVLRDILLPFVVGMAIAYFLNPLTTRLQHWKVSRTIATLLIMLAFIAITVTAALLLFPLLQAQVASFAVRVPGYLEKLRASVMPFLEHAWTALSDEQAQKLKDAAGGQAGAAIKWVGGLLKKVWSGGLALFELISLVVITPIVAFYMLRDWETFVHKIDGWLPQRHAGTIRGLAKRIDDTIAGFVRGQASVCLILALYYGLALSVVGLEFGLIVGLFAGLISFIPYVGASLGLLGGVGLAYAQFPDWTPVVMVAAVFGVGQVLESYALTPKLVGDKVGLHPVWIIFALMAGGALFGFTGMLLAIPVAAVTGVLIRFAISRYLDSPLYTGGGDSSST
ncbi:MAG: AI-2E family transporter [Rhodospirillales bacterium]